MVLDFFFTYRLKLLQFVIGECGPGGSSGKALGYGLGGPGSIPGVGRMEIFFTPSCSDWPWGPLNLL